MEDFEKILLQKAVRITPMRQLLLEYFLAENTVIDIAILENAFPKADRITIYRTLKTFEEKGIIHSIENGKAAVKYALCNEYCSPKNHLDHHPHFHCTVCGQITCLESVIIPNLSLPEGYDLQEMRMTIKGICQKC